MRLVVFANGTHGDVEPHVALAAGLRAAGHQVRFCTHSHFQRLVQDHDLEFFSLGGADPRTVMQQVQAATVKTHRLSRLRAHLFQRRPPDPERLDELRTACLDADAILSSVGTVFHIAERLARPLIQTALYPVHPTRAFPHYLAPLPGTLEPWANRFSHHLVRQLFWQVDRRWVNRWRQQTLHLPPISLWGPFRNLDQRRVPCWYGFSQHVIPRPGDWPDWLQITGYWLLEDEVPSWEPTPDLLRFFDTGPPPVAIGFGSLVDPDPDELHRVILDALAQTDQRAILLSGWKSSHPAAAGSPRIDQADLTPANQKGEDRLPDNVRVTDWVPFGWLLPRVRALVHHGGAGTIAKVLRAGLPSVAIPYSGEQRFWSARLAAIGACPPPLPRRQLTTAKLAQALRLACGDETLRHHAQQLARCLHAENGVARAVECFERWRRAWVVP
ncbi:MAG: glycosyltransferase [Verrucomicrobia bacterium]|nr:glycosyltransferase [Verrucomicrobiota bacterium]